MQKTEKINWLLILQGWSMLLVVVGHAGLNGLDLSTEPAFSRIIREHIYSFHMPLFMVISGYLYYLTKVQRNTSYTSLIRNKLHRLGIPFLFFTAATICVKPWFNSLMGRPAQFGLGEFINAILYPQNNPLGEMWFIGTLFMLFLYSPIFKFALKNIYTEIGLLVIVLCLRLIPIQLGIELFCFDITLQYAVWFYTGMLFCKYSVHNKLDKFIWLPLSIVLYGITYYVYAQAYSPISSFLVTAAGCLMSFSLAININKIYPKCFSSFRNYTYQIYLMAIFFQWLFRVVYEHSLFPQYYLPCYILNIWIGLYIPVLIAVIIKKINCKFISPLFGLSK